MATLVGKTFHQYVLKRHASEGEGIVADLFDWQERPFPELADGDVAVKVTHLSCDPTQRNWVCPFPGYLPNVQVGEVMRASGLGDVVASKNSSFAVGDRVVGLFGWREYAVGKPADIPHLSKVSVPSCSATRSLTSIQIPSNTPVEFALGLAGFSGLTAYLGLFK